MRFLRAVGQKGTLTLPSEIREVLDVHDGDIVEFEVVGVVRRRNAASKASDEKNTKSTNA